MAQMKYDDHRVCARPIYVIDDGTGDVLGTSDAPIYIQNATGGAEPDPANVTYGSLTSQTSGNATPLEVVPANPNRRTIFITNISNVPIYFSFGSGFLLTTTTFAFKLNPDQAAFMDPPQTLQSVWAISGAANKMVTYLEGV